jgi:hypothetical protein
MLPQVSEPTDAETPKWHAGPQKALFSQYAPFGWIIGNYIFDYLTF